MLEHAPRRIDQPLDQQHALEPTGRFSAALKRWKRHSIGNGIGPNGEEGNVNSGGLMSTDTLPIGIPLTTEHLPKSMRHRDLPGMSQAPEGSVTSGETSSPESRKEYPTDRDHPVNKKYWNTVLLPRFEEVAERNLHGKSYAEKEEYVGGLIDAYTIVEQHPEDILGQINALRRIAVSDEYIPPAKEIMSDLKASREAMFEEFDMVTNLAQLEGMIDIFTESARLQNDTSSEVHPAESSTRKEKERAITAHVTGLLGAYLSSKTDSPDQGYYSERFVELHDALAEKKEKIENASLHRADAESRRIILRTSEHFKSYEDTLSLEGQTGLTEAKVKETKRERRKEYAKSTAWMAGIEGGQIGLGWALGGATAEMFDLKNLVAVAIIAGVGRAATSALLYEKQKLSGDILEETGVAPDPITKLFGDKFRKPRLGFGAAHWPMEGVYAGSTIVAMNVLGAIPGLATEIAADVLAIPRQIGEIIEMKMKIEKTNLTRGEWVMQKSKEKVEKTKAKVKNVGRHILRKDSHIAVDASTIDTLPDVLGRDPRLVNSTGGTLFTTVKEATDKPGVNA